jgi:GntR family transcriptional regulator/MocR family aminotransferase
LAAQDWIRIEPRKGAVVSTNLPVIKPRTFQGPEQNPGYVEDAAFTFEPVIPALDRKKLSGKSAPIVINDGFTDIRLAPLEAILREYYHVFKEPEILSGGTRDFTGSLSLKEATRDFLNDTRGLNIAADHILITRGAQMAIFLAASLLIKPGDKVIVSSPNYLVADALFSNLGAGLLRVPVDEAGMDIGRVEQLLASHQVKLLYITPHHHHPTTVTLSASRRAHLLRLINKYNLPVIEDDYDYDFQYESNPILPLASSNHHGNVIYVGSFTKVLAPSFRVGYMVAPLNFIGEAAKLKSLIDFSGDPLMEEVISRLIVNGEIGRHIKKLNKVYAKRCDQLCTLLRARLSHALSFIKPTGGMAVWVRFSDSFPLEEIIPKLGASGLIFRSSLYPDFEHRKGNAIRIGFASLNEQEITKAITLLEASLGEKK